MLLSRRFFAINSAFSAARLRRQYLTEGLVLSALGGAMGLVAAAAVAALALIAGLVFAGTRADGHGERGLRGRLSAGRKDRQGSVSRHDQRLGVSEGTSKSQLFSARRSMRRLLDPPGSKPGDVT